MNHDSDSDAVYSDRAERTARLTVMSREVGRLNGDGR